MLTLVVGSVVRSILLSTCSLGSFVYDVYNLALFKNIFVFKFYVTYTRNSDWDWVLHSLSMSYIKIGSVTELSLVLLVAFTRVGVLLLRCFDRWNRILRHVHVCS